MMTPLTDDELTKMFHWLKDELPCMWADGRSSKSFFKNFAYMIERHHGIRKENDEEKENS